MCHWEPYNSSNSSARAIWYRIGNFGGLWGAHDAKNTQQGTICGTISSHEPLNSYLTSKCAAGRPTPAAAAASEHFCTELALFAGCGAHKTPKTRSRALSAGQSHHMGLYAHFCTFKCAAGSPTTAAAAAREHYGHAATCHTRGVCHRQSLLRQSLLRSRGRLAMTVSCARAHLCLFVGFEGSHAIACNRMRVRAKEKHALS